MSFLGDKSLVAWGAFNLFVLALIALDLGLLNRHAKRVGFREAVFWNVAWTGLGLGFAGAVLWLYGPRPALEYVTGYVIERALSVDNIFVFVVIFRYFGVAGEHQRRVLYWGILGALMMRAVFIVAGAAVVALFHWVLYLFGAFLVYTGVMLLVKEEEAPDPERNLAVRAARRLFPVEPRFHGERFVIRKDGRWHATPMLVVFLVVASTDFVFALDSIPAIFGVTQDPFIIYTSNVMAILGMRVLYFLLAALLPYFRFLRHGLSAVLVFIGARMLIEEWLDIPIVLALGLVVAILGAAVTLSVLFPARPEGARAD